MSALLGRLGGAAAARPWRTLLSWLLLAVALTLAGIRIDDTDPAGCPRSRRYVAEVLEVGPLAQSGRPGTTRLYSRPLPGAAAQPVFVPTGRLTARLASQGFDPTRLWHPRWARNPAAAHRAARC